MLEYRDLIELGLSRDVHALTSRAVAAAEALGFGLCSGLMIQGRYGSPSAIGRSFGNPPPAFLERSKSLDDGLRDPLLTRLLRTPGHHQYDQNLYVEAGAVDLWDCQAAFGYRCGLSWSMHQQGHAEAFLFGVDTPDALPTNPARLLELRASLQMIGVHARAAMSRIAEVPEAAELDRAEREALQVVGAKIYAQRRVAFEVSELTDPNLVSGARKLGAPNAVEAVVRAIQGGQVTP